MQYKLSTYALPEVICIYNIVFIDKKLKYVGSTNNFRKRIVIHHSDLRRGKHHNQYLQRVYNKYGENRFYVEILEETTLEKLVEREQYYADLFKSFDRKYGFNFSECTKNAFRGQKHTQETKDLLSRLHKGHKMPEEVKRNLIRINTGSKRSPEALLKLKQAAKINGLKRRQLIELVSPDGELITRTGLLNFCEEFNLCSNLIIKVLQGKIPHHHGWRKYLGNNLMPYHPKPGEAFDEKQRRDRIRLSKIGKSQPRRWKNFFYLKTPEGLIIQSNNITELSKEIDLTYCQITELLYDQKESINGYTKTIFEPNLKIDIMKIYKKESPLKGIKFSEERKIKLSKSHIGFKHSKEQKKKIVEILHNRHQKQKYPIKLISPSGEIVERVGLNNFCDEFNLVPAAIKDLLRGARTEYNGWTRPKEAQLIEFKINNIKGPFYLKNSEGLIIKTNAIKKFCEEMVLNRCELANLLKGRRESYCGYCQSPPVDKPDIIKIYTKNRLNPPPQISNII